MGERGIVGPGLHTPLSSFACAHSRDHGDAHIAERPRSLATIMIGPLMTCSAACRYTR